MPHTYVQDVRRTVDNLSADNGLIPKERLILLNMMADYIAKVRKGLEKELAGSAGDLIC
jgi:hypothetical protein